MKSNHYSEKKRALLIGFIVLLVLLALIISCVYLASSPNLVPIKIPEETEETVTETESPDYNDINRRMLSENKKLWMSEENGSVQGISFTNEGSFLWTIINTTNGQMQVFSGDFLVSGENLTFNVDEKSGGGSLVIAFSLVDGTMLYLGEGDSKSSFYLNGSIKDPHLGEVEVSEDQEITVPVYYDEAPVYYQYPANYNGYPIDYSVDYSNNNSQQYEAPENTICYTCHGVGSCLVCKGTGQYSLYGNPSSVCTACGGTGKCWHCNGSGKQ